MKFYCNLYVSEELKGREREIIYKLRHDQVQLNKYIIVFAQSMKNHLEFYDSVLLLQKCWGKENLFVVGIADGYESALNLVARIVSEVYEATGDVQIRTYLSEQQRDFEARRM